MQKYIVIVIQGFNEEAPGGHLIDVCNIELMEDDPNVALERAKKLISKKFYRVASIIENYVKP